MSEPTTVHVCRHGQVDNPDGILYGRLPDYHLSDLGRQMAERLGEYFADTSVQALRCSPLERAQETMAPIAARHPELDVVTDSRLIEADNRFAGTALGLNRQTLLNWRSWWWLRNPLRPSWGEPYRDIVRRVRAAIADAAAAAGPGGTAIVVAHQLPIWMARRSAEGRSLAHDPRNRECTLASVTSFTLRDGRVTRVDYAEPARDLLPGSTRQRRLGRFRAGA